MDSRLRGNDETCPREGGDEISACHSRESGNPVCLYAKALTPIY